MTISSRSFLNPYSGKVVRRDTLPSAISAPHADPLAQQLWMKQALVNIWCQVLNLKQVDVHANFFDLGGDALHAAEILSLARMQGMHFSLGQFVHHPTIAEMVQIITFHH